MPSTQHVTCELIHVDAPGAILPSAPAAHLATDAEWQDADNDAETASRRLTPSVLSLEGALLTMVLPYIDMARVLYIYSCVPLQFLDKGWPLWQFSALIFLASVVRNAAAAFIMRRGDRACVHLLLLSTVLSALMVWKPDDKAAVCVGVVVSNACKCIQAYICLDGYCSTVQDLLDWFEVDLGFTKP